MANEAYISAGIHSDDEAAENSVMASAGITSKLPNRTKVQLGLISLNLMNLIETIRKRQVQSLNLQTFNLSILPFEYQQILEFQTNLIKSIDLQTNLIDEISLRSNLVENINLRTTLDF